MRLLSASLVLVPVAAALVGWFAERGFDRRVLSMFGVMMLGAAVLYVPGLLWLAKFTGYDKVLELGLYPFLWGDLLKAALAAIAFPAAWSYLSSKR